MRRARSMGRRHSKRSFKRSARVHKRNFTHHASRGGIRL